MKINKMKWKEGLKSSTSFLLGFVKGFLVRVSSLPKQLRCRIKNLEIVFY